MRRALLRACRRPHLQGCKHVPTLPALSAPSAARRYTHLVTASRSRMRIVRASAASGARFRLLMWASPPACLTQAFPGYLHGRSLCLEHCRCHGPGNSSGGLHAHSPLNNSIAGARGPA